MRKMRQLTEEAEAEEMSQEELLKRFEKIESQSAECKSVYYIWVCWGEMWEKGIDMGMGGRNGGTGHLCFPYYSTSINL